MTVRANLLSNVPHTFRVRIAALMATSLLVAGCASSGGSATRSGAENSPSTTPSAVASSASSSTGAGATTAGYVAAVNALCQDLLPKILPVTNDGDPSGFTVAQFKAHVAAHAALEHDFDRKFAAIPVPPDARQASAAMRAYIAYANRIDSRRLAAANRGQHAFAAEVHAEGAEYLSSSVKKARDAAGFDAACDAR
jgi:hypothetical protein